jgi:hypothetical protein
MSISRQPSAIQIMRDQKQPENDDSFGYVGSVMTDDATFTGVIKSTIAMAKAAFNMKMTKWVR